MFDCSWTVGGIIIISRLWDPGRNKKKTNFKWKPNNKVSNNQSNPTSSPKLLGMLASILKA